MLNVIEPINQIYVVSVANTDYGSKAFDYINNYQMYNRVYTDYVEATKRLLDLASLKSTDNMVWLDVYELRNNVFAQKGRYFYNFYGHTEEGLKIILELDSTQFDYKFEDICKTSVYYEIQHYIPKGYEKLYKRAKMEIKLDK